jgi:hypothetical protein
MRLNFFLSQLKFSSVILTQQAKKSERNLRTQRKKMTDQQINTKLPGRQCHSFTAGTKAKGNG